MPVGAMRTCAQMVSYEVSLALSVLGVVLTEFPVMPVVPGLELLGAVPVVPVLPEFGPAPPPLAVLAELLADPVRGFIDFARADTAGQA